jgi:hypothetical protein
MMNQIDGFYFRFFDFSQLKNSVLTINIIMLKHRKGILHEMGVGKIGGGQCAQTEPCLSMLLSIDPDAISKKNGKNS